MLIVKVKSLSCVRLCETPWTAASQASPSMGFSRQEHWSGLPFPSPSDLCYLTSKCNRKWLIGSKSVEPGPKQPLACSAISLSPSQKEW